jgi:hypothetical protein
MSVLVAFPASLPTYCLHRYFSSALGRLRLPAAKPGCHSFTAGTKGMLAHCQSNRAGIVVPTAGLLLAGWPMTSKCRWGKLL